MKLIDQVSIEIIAAGINLERDWNFKEVNGKRCIVEEDYAKARSGRYNGVEGFYFNRADGFEFDSEEQELITEELKNSGKPEDIAKKISSGKMNKFKEENSLMTQQWVMEPKKKVKDIINELGLKDLKIVDYYRIKIGD